MHLAESQLTFVRPVPDHDVEQPAIEDQHTRQDDLTGDIADVCVVQELIEGVDELRFACAGLQHRGGDLQSCPGSDQVKLL